MICRSSPRNRSQAPRGRRGFGLIEIVIAAGVIGVMLFSISAVSRLALGAIDNAEHEARANFLLAEGMEVVKLLRDQSWAEYMGKLTATGVTYYPVFSSGSWTLSASNPGPIDGVFTRTVVFSDVSRCTPNGSATDDDIAGPGVSCPSGTALDPETRHAVVTVSWTGRGGVARSRTLETYVANVFKN